jgi:hypothetical protein
MHELQAAVDNCVTFNHMTELREELLPKVLQVEASQQKVLNDNDDMRLCIANFDEVLLTKANKAALLTLEEEIRLSFVKQFDWQDLKTSLVANDKSRGDVLAKLLADNNEFQSNLMSEVQEIVNNITDTKFANYDRVANSFSKFFNSEELEKALNNKADLHLIEGLRVEKAALVKVQNCEALIEALNIRLKHLGILQSELAKSAVPN